MGYGMRGHRLVDYGVNMNKEWIESGYAARQTNN